MKKAFISVFILLLLTQGLVFAVWEGRAVAADAKDFPSRGMYVLTDLCPENTLVYVQNVESGPPVRAAVAGKSNMADVIASLSPELALALNIRAGTVTRVRIFLPPEASEIALQNFSSASADSIDSGDPDLNPKALIAMESEISLALRETQPEVALVPSAPNPPPRSRAPIVEDAVKNVMPLPRRQTREAAPKDSPVRETRQISRERVINRPQDSAVSSVAALPEPERKREMPRDSAVSSVAVLPEPERKREMPQDNAVSSVAALPEPERKREMPQDNAVSSIAALPEKDNRRPAPEDIAVSEVRQVRRRVARKKPPEDIVVSEVGRVRTPQLARKNAPEDIVVSEVGRIRTPQLARKNAPEDIAVSEVLSIVAKEKKPSPRVDEPVVEVAKVEVREEVIEKPKASAEKSTKASSGKSTFEKSTFERKEEVSIASSALERGYYVQIASYSDDANIRQVLDSYGSIYPIAFVDSGAKSSRAKTKVLVGSLSADETGAVLDFFRKEGFSDAFVIAVK